MSLKCITVLVSDFDYLVVVLLVVIIAKMGDGGRKGKGKKMKNKKE